MRTLLFLIVVTALFATAFILFIAENQDPDVQRQRNNTQQLPETGAAEPPADAQSKAGVPSLLSPSLASPAPQSPPLAEALGVDTLDISLLPDIPSAVVADAKSYISALTRPTAEPLNIEDADNFVNQNQILSLLQDAPIEDLVLDDLIGDENLRPHDSITVVREVEEFIPMPISQLIATYSGELKETIKVNLAGTVQEMSINDILSQYTENPAQPLLVAKKIRRFEVTTPEALASSAIPSYNRVRFIRGSYKLKMATVADLISEQREVAPNSIFYVRTVKHHDNQGLWGIIHAGLTTTFAAGIGVQQDHRTKNLQVYIPRYADEKIGSRSSFLGRLIYTKAFDSFVYNFKQQRMGENPNRIYPGQELVIIAFQPEELVRIYNYFSNSNTG